MRSRAPVPCKLFNKSWAVFSSISDQKWKLKRSIWWHMVGKKVDGSHFNMFSTFYKNIRDFCQNIVSWHDAMSMAKPLLKYGHNKKACCFHKTFIDTFTHHQKRWSSAQQLQQSTIEIRQKHDRIQCKQKTSNLNRRCRKMRQKVINNKFANDSKKRKKERPMTTWCLFCLRCDIVTFTFSRMTAYFLHIRVGFERRCCCYLINDLLV